ncbi:MAG: hypothetical protein J6B01_04400 [Ruminococcus sp.]|nr:hypothetical protein [Ruminococcus sp.]
MGITPSCLLIGDNQTIADILKSMPDIGQLKINDGVNNGIYIGEEIKAIPNDILNRVVTEAKFRKCDYGYFAVVRI